MNDKNTPAVQGCKDEEHALVEALTSYLSSETHDPLKERQMMDVARKALTTGRRLKRPSDVDVGLWQEASAALREAAQHKILADGSAVVLGFMPVTIGVKNGSLHDCGGVFNAQQINQLVNDIITDVKVQVADGWFSEDQVKDAQCSDLHALLNMITDGKRLTGHWEPRVLSIDESKQYARVFLAVTLTTPGPLPDGWAYDWPFQAIALPDPEQYKQLEDTLWKTVDHTHNVEADIYVQIMEPLLHEDALAESQTQLDLLHIEDALQQLNAMVDDGKQVEADLRLQVVWPQAPEENQHPESQPSLRLRVLYRIKGEERAHQTWYPISYDSKNVDLWHDLLVEVMQMVYSLGHGFLQVQQISGAEFQHDMMMSMPAPARCQ